MWKASIATAAAACLLAAATAPAAADGRRVMRRGWVGGEITANVITPDYFPYHGRSYSYNGPNYYPGPYVRCWPWRHGWDYWGC